MKPLDYGSSFLIGKAAWNEVRFWVESRTVIIDEAQGTEEQYIQAASCKSEDTFAERDLFQQDNYDFLPVFGPSFGVVFRRKAWQNPNYKTVVPTEELWRGQAYHLVDAAACHALQTSTEILDATARFEPLVAQTEIWCEETRLRAIIEYPIKTMNTRAADGAYQVDTGPVAFPDLSARHERNADGLSLAFVAFNAPDFADFVIEEPCSINASSGTASVYHYSRRLSLPASNRLYATRTANP